MFYFEQVSLLITHYKRSKSLERLLAALQAIDCRFGEIIVSDDGSPEPHASYISNELKNKYDFKFVTASSNKGLGNNMNKGQEATSKPYVLYIQEDFLPDPAFPMELQRALQYMEADHSIDMTRFFSHSRYPYMKPFTKDLDFSITYYAPFATRYTKIYNYSDLPHLRRNNFIEKFGPYREGIPGDRTEYWMCISYFRKKGKTLFYNDYRKLFDHENSAHEPSMMVRKSISTSDNAVLRVVRHVYRHLKYNYDIFLKKI